MAIAPAQLVGDPRPPEAWESGFKDTVTAYPGEVTRIRARFDTPGQFVWHCHIVSHEDNEMMRPYRIGPADPAAPGS
jgi:FtsP/CotA-like multicopper oxidase with cupredoxin domain